MKIHVKKEAVVQYFLIYLMLLIPGSCFYRLFLNDYKYYIFFAGYFLFWAIAKKFELSYEIVFCGLWFIICTILRLIIGGIGLSAILSLVICILAVYTAINYDVNSFLPRFIKVIVFLAKVSLICWALLCLFPMLADYWPGIESNWNSNSFSGEYVYSKGLFFYSYVFQNHPTRNCGIYTEPGVYQIILNSALFILLFWQPKIKSHFSRNVYKINIIILIIAILSTQSTSGYIGLFCIVCFYMLSRQKKREYNWKFTLLVLILIVGVALIVEYMINGENSILYKQIILKLFPNGRFDVTEGTGQYRWNMIEYAWDVFIHNPFGLGYDSFYQDPRVTESVAAPLVSYLAVYGIIPWGVLMAFLLYPIFKFERNIIGFVFILLFINTSLGQTDLFYPSLLVIPLFLNAQKHKRATIKSVMNKKEVING